MTADSVIGTPPRTLLLVEDNVGDARLVEERLKRGWTRNLDVHHTTRLDQAAGHLAGHRADCVLLDLSLPDSEGAEGVTRLVDAFPEIPIVVLSGTNEEALVLQCLHQGAQDYLVKDTADGALIGRSVRYAVERKRAEHQLQGTDEAQRRVYRVATAGVTLVPSSSHPSWTEGGVTWSNQPATTGTAATAPSPSSAAWMEWTVTSQVEAMYAGSNHGLQVRDAAETSGSAEQTFRSRDYDGIGSRELVLTFG